MPLGIFRRPNGRRRKGLGTYDEDRYQTWAMIQAICADHELSIEACLRYMIGTEHGAMILRRRFCQAIPETLHTIQYALGWRGSPGQVEQAETRALLQLLRRLVAYDRHIRLGPITNGLIVDEAVARGRTNGRGRSLSA